MVILVSLLFSIPPLLRPSLFNSIPSHTRVNVITPPPPSSLPSPPTFTQTQTNLVHEMADNIATLSMDPRLQVACQFEAELYTRFYKRCLNWNKAKSSLGYDHKFKSGDMPVEVERRRKWWEGALADPRKYFPATHARIDKLAASGKVPSHISIPLLLFLGRLTPNFFSCFVTPPPPPLSSLFPSFLSA